MTPMHYTRADPAGLWFIDPVPAPAGKILPPSECLEMLESLGLPLADGRQSQYPAIAVYSCLFLSVIVGTSLASPLLDMPY